MKRNIIIALCAAAIIVAIPVTSKLFSGKTAVNSGLITATSSTNAWVVPDGLSKSIDEIIAEQKKSTSTPEETKELTPTTATDRLARDLFEKYINIRKNGAEITTDISDKLAENILSQDYSDPLVLYTADNIRIQADTSSSAIKTYGNKLASILSAPSVGFQSEIEIFGKLSTEPLSNFSDELMAKKKRYETMRSQVLSLPAPAEVRRLQANMANSLTIFIEAINGAFLLDGDPVGALPKIGNYGNGIDILTNAFIDYGTYFKSKGITFSANEKGSLFSI